MDQVTQDDITALITIINRGQTGRFITDLNGDGVTDQQDVNHLTDYFEGRIDTLNVCPEPEPEPTPDRSEIDLVRIVNLSKAGESSVRVEYAINNDRISGAGQTLTPTVEIIAEHRSSPATERIEREVTVPPGEQPVFSDTINAFRSDTFITVRVTDPNDGSVHEDSQNFSFITDTPDQSELTANLRSLESAGGGSVDVTFDVINQVTGGSGETLSGTITITANGNRVGTVSTGNIPPGETRSFTRTVSVGQTGQVEICVSP